MLFLLKKLIISLYSLNTIYYADGPNIQHRQDLKPVPFNETHVSSENSFFSNIRLHDEDGSFFCTATVFDAYHALTAAHCVTGSFGFMSKDRIKVYSSTGVFLTIARAEAMDAMKDSAIIRGDFSKVKSMPVDFTGQMNIPVGAVLKSCGYPTGQDEWYCIPLVFTGNYDFQYRGVGAPIFQGCSGGPVIYNDVLIGVNSAVYKDSILIGPIIGLHAIIKYR